MKNLIILTNEDKTCSRMKKMAYCKIQGFKIHFKSIHKKIPILENSVYLLLKKVHKIDRKLLKKIKERSNIIIYEVVDIFHQMTLDSYVNAIKKFCGLCDLVICNNKHHARLLNDNGLPSSCVYHHSDAVVQKNSGRSSDVCYVGYEFKQSLTHEQFETYSIKLFNPFQKTFFQNMTCGIQIDFVLSNHLQFHIHTTTKLATAIYTNSVFICNRQPVYIELLGEDYELYIDDDLSNMQVTIDKAKAIYNDEVLLNAYVQKYTYVRMQLSIENCIQMYQQLLDKYK